jgi:hypothetical protein
MTDAPPIPTLGSTARWGVWPERLLIALLPFLLYAESLGFPLLGLDDQMYYLANPALHGGGWRGLAEIWTTSTLSDYAPIGQLTIWLDLAIAGSDHWWFARLHGLAWFALGALGVHALVLRLTASRGLALAVGLVYAVHPVNAQSVLWLAERKNLVSFALAMWCVERYVAVRRGQAGWPALLVAWTCGIAAVLAKPHAIALPAMLAAYELCLETGTWRSRLLRLALPFAAVAAFTLLNIGFVRTDLHRAPLGGSLGAALLADGPILLRYLWHTVKPTGLTIYYAVCETPLRDLALVAGAWAAVAAVVGLSLIPGRTRRLVAFAWLFAAAALAPALNLVPQLAPMTDHYQQWALPGLLLIACLLADDLLGRSSAASDRRAAPLVLAGAAVFMAALSLARVPEFADKTRLFAAAVKKQPDSAINWTLHAFCLLDAADPALRAQAGPAAAQALACADQARIFPIDRLSIVVIAAVSLHERGRREEAAALVEREAALLTSDADIGIVRGEVALRTGQPALAVAALAKLFTPPLQAVAAQLRSRCRDGSVLPDAMPPLVDIAQQGGALADQATRTTWLQAQDRLLASLAAAHLANGDAEHAFDVAAVLVNLDPGFATGRQLLAAAYRRLGVPAAADRLGSAGSR